MDVDPDVPTVNRIPSMQSKTSQFYFGNPKGNFTHSFKGQKTHKSTT